LKKYLCLKKFGYQRKLLFYGLKGYHHCYQWDTIVYQYTNTFGFFNFIKDKPIYTDAGNWLNWGLHPRKWRMIARYYNKTKIFFEEELSYDTHFYTWEKLYPFTMGGVGKQYWVILSYFFFF